MSHRLFVFSLFTLTVACSEAVVELRPRTTLAAEKETQKKPHDRPAWAGWRGADRDGQVSRKAWPKDLKSERLVKQWRVKMGQSYSGPIVAADQVFTTASEKGREVVRAYHRDNGKLLWQTEWAGSMSVPFFAARNGSWIRATPALGDQSLYVAGMRDFLVNIDTQTGKTRWSVDLAKRHSSPIPSFGFVCSPLIHGDSLYTQAGGGFVKMDLKSGTNTWRTLADAGGMWGSAFSSPIITTLAGKLQAVVQTRSKLAGVDLKNGKVLWEMPIKAFRGMNILTPMAVGKDLVFTSSYGGKSQLIRIQKANDQFNATVVWSNKLQGYMSSPVLIEGHLYLHLRNQRLACIEVKSGNIKWVSSKLYGKYWSMVTNGKQILGLDQEGVLYLIDANPNELTVIDSRKVSDEETWAHLALAGDELIIRELNALSSWKWSEPKTAQR